MPLTFTVHRVRWASQNPRRGVVNSVHVRYWSPRAERITEFDIHRVFVTFGRVEDVTIKESTADAGTGRQCGYGFVHFSSQQDGVHAAFNSISALDNATIDGITFNVELSRNLMKQFGEQAVGPPVREMRAPSSPPVLKPPQYVPQHVQQHMQQHAQHAPMHQPYAYLQQGFRSVGHSPPSHRHSNGQQQVPPAPPMPLPAYASMPPLPMDFSNMSPRKEHSHSHRSSPVSATTSLECMSHSAPMDSYLGRPPRHYGTSSPSNIAIGPPSNPSSRSISPPSVDSMLSQPSCPTFQLSPQASQGIASHVFSFDRFETDEYLARSESNLFNDLLTQSRIGEWTNTSGTPRSRASSLLADDVADAMNNLTFC